MLLEPTIARDQEPVAGRSQAALQAIGLDHVRQLSRRLWTDHNLHDPGITALELLCYALTDLHYRADFPIEDLLATKTDNEKTMSGQFFRADEILPNRPLTELDYRKLVIDLPGVKDAWIRPAPTRLFANPVTATLMATYPGAPGARPVTVRGRFDVLVEYMDDVTAPEARAAVDAVVLARLAANRNLCEDFVAVRGVPTQDYSLCAELELETSADVVEVIATLQFHVQRALAPAVHNYTLAEMLALTRTDGTRYTLPDVFTGPRLEHGFIPDSEVAASALAGEVRLSDVISVIMDIPGVRAVRDIVMNALDPKGEAIPPADPWRLPVPEGTRPHLLPARCRIVAYKRHLPVVPPADAVERRRAELEAAERAKLEGLEKEKVPIPMGRSRDVASYYSVQHHFPELYGISAVGLLADATPARRAQALQLKAYLLFFDQVMANYAAQLSHVRDLFAHDPAHAHTYFAQVVRSIPEHEKLYAAEVNDDAKLSALFESDADALLRRDRLLDHLLARFAEDLQHYVAIERSLLGASVRRGIPVKCAFLAGYPALGADRSLAYNHRLTQPAELWDTDNVSGLERRLAALLGIADASRRSLATVDFGVGTRIDTGTDNTFGFALIDPDTDAVLLESATRHPDEAAARAAVVEAIGLALRAGSYRRDQTGEEHAFRLVDAAGTTVAQSPATFRTTTEMDTAIDALLTQLLGRYGGEGFHLVENLLLLPQAGTDPLLPICVDPGCSDCPDDDPYSYRVHFMLPAYAGRFANMDFRRFVEETIRLETPAHILPKICWVDPDDMAVFENAWSAWLEARAGGSDTQRAEALQALIQTLFTVKNVYPESRLSDPAAEPGAGSGPPPTGFILGRSALGTVDTDGGDNGGDDP